MTESQKQATATRVKALLEKEYYADNGGLSKGQFLMVAFQTANRMHNDFLSSSLSSNWYKGVGTKQA